jgi:hypothetical protein
MAWPIGSYTNLNTKDICISNSAVFFMYSGSEYAFKSLTVLSNSIVICESDTATGNSVTIRAGDMTIENGAVVTTDEFGFKNTGPGSGANAGNYSGGGGYGGRGGDGYNNYQGGSTYGSATNPVSLGSGGGKSGAGGGAVKLNIIDTLIIDGIISANGSDGIGGGSGGSIWIAAQDIEGTGRIAADAGNSTGANAGGGGGGRIAVIVCRDNYTEEEEGIYTNYPGSANGYITVDGGTGYTPGTNGTFYLKINPAVDGTVFSFR